MKKILIGLVIGMVLALPVGTFAWNTSQGVTPIRAYNCSSVRDTGELHSCNGVVNRFDDRDNTCYITKQDSISCVKK